MTEFARVASFAITAVSLALPNLGCDLNPSHDTGNPLQHMCLPEHALLASFVISETSRKEDLQLLSEKNTRLNALCGQIVPLEHRFGRLPIVSEFISEAHANVLSTQDSLCHLIAQAKISNDPTSMSLVAELMREAGPVDQKFLEMLTQLNSTKSDFAAYTLVCRVVRESDDDVRVREALRGYAPHSLKKYELFKSLLR